MDMHKFLVKERTYNHLLSVKKCSIQQLNQHINEAFNLWNNRNQYD